MRSDYPCEQLPAMVREQVEQIRVAVKAAIVNSSGPLADGWSEPDVDQAFFDQWLLPVCAVSPYLTRTAQSYPDAIQRLLVSGVLSPASQLPGRKQLLKELDLDLASEMVDAAAAIADSKAIEVVRQRTIRRFRHRHMFRILWRDLSNITPLHDTLRQLSLLADTCVTAADAWVYQTLVNRFGEPLDHSGKRQRLVVLGMGKLGGFELNVSSDIDLICLYAQAGQTTGDVNGRRQVDNAEFFQRSVQGLTRLLNSVTQDGFAFRVDTRLRPFGESGPLVMNFEGLEQYYLTQAREWERYAMIKARAITGLQADINTLEALITPFVYRRYLDYNAFESLRELKKKITLSVLQKGMVDNIKLGSGGIREVEFIGQAFQLVRGGQDARLRERSIVAVLKQLARQKLMPQDDVINLLAAYDYLRRTENAVQMMRDEQVHSLPVDAVDRQRLLAIMDEPDWPAFVQQLSTFQDTVANTFAGLFEADDSVQSAADDRDATLLTEYTAGNAALSGNGRSVRTERQRASDLASRVWLTLIDSDATNEQRSEALEIVGFSSSPDLLSAIEALSRGAFYQRLAASGQRRVERIVPLILQMSASSTEPSETLQRCLAFVRSVAGRSGYLQVLIDQPGALARLVNLFAQSRWLANFVLRQPMVIDELLGAGRYELYPDAATVREDAREQLDRLREAELDVQMDTLRHYRQAREMRIACAQLDGSLALMQVSDQLTWLAESLIEVVLILVKEPLYAKHGHPTCVDEGQHRRTQTGVLAYGKLGGIELGFGSDLDLVFLHDSRGEQQHTNGKKSIDNTVFYARLAQKFVSFMGTLTPAGKLYEIDLRLRPNGNSGVLVSGIQAFANYQKADAWTWEHQALMRARMVYGAPNLHEQFNRLRRRVLAQVRSSVELKEAVASMRERMRSHLGSHQEDQLHLKQDSGGIADIEFIVQYLVLAHAANHPELLIYTDNIRVLDQIQVLELLSVDDATQLRNCYIGLRERLHRQVLQEASATVPLDDKLTALRDTVAAIRQRILGPA